ncbi:MAG: hypothetical protein K6A63_05205 [Acholeplasmatales bacterium]|nr:hypothetical protein [Acholeplasmatales bacterium]
MPKMKLKEFAAKYQENINNSDPSLNVNMENIINTSLNYARSYNQYKDLMAHIAKNYGDDKAYEFIVNVLKTRKQKDPEFDYDAAIEKLQNDTTRIKFQRLATQIDKLDPNVPNVKALKAEIDKGGILKPANFMKIGMQATLDKILELGGKEYQEYVSHSYDHIGEIPYDEIKDYIGETLDPSLGDNKAAPAPFNLDAEIDTEPYVLDLSDDDIVENTYDDIIADVKKNQNLSDDEVRKIRTIVNQTSNNTNDSFDAFRSNVESKSTKLLHSLEDPKYTKFREEYTEANPNFISPVVKTEYEYFDTQSENSFGLKLSPDVLEGLKEGLKYIEGMNLKPVRGEEGQKSYAFNEITRCRDLVLSSTKRIADLKNELKEKEAANNPSFKEEIEAIKADITKNEAQLVANMKEYEKAEAQMDGLMDIVTKNFKNTKVMNNNVEVTRSDFIAPKYRKNILGASHANGLFHVYSFLKRGNVSVDEFLKDPGNALDKAYDNIHHVKDLAIIGNETFDQEMDKLVNIHYESKTLDDRSADLVTASRAFEFLSVIDGENTPQNTAAHKNFYDQLTTYSSHQGNNIAFKTNALQSYENILIADELKPHQVLADDFINPLTRTVMHKPYFDLNEYVNSHQMKPSVIMDRYKKIVASMIRKNVYNEAKSSAKHTKDFVGKSIIDVTKSLQNATLKYIQKYGIDPDKVTDPNEKLMIKSITDPDQFVRDMGYYDYDFDLRPNKDLVEKINRHKESNIKKSAKNLENELIALEKRIMDAERAYDIETQKIQGKLDKMYDKYSKEGFEGQDSFENAMVEYRNYRMNHLNELKIEYEKGNIPRSFYLNRIEQVNAGAPLGDELKFYGNKPSLTEKQFIDEQLEMNDERPENERITKDQAKKMYKDMKKEFKEEKNTMLMNLAHQKANGDAEIDLSIKPEMKARGTLFYSDLKWHEMAQIIREEDKIEKAKETENKVNIHIDLDKKDNNIINENDDLNISSINVGIQEKANNEMNINSINEDDELNNSRVGIHIDLGDKVVSEKSQFIEQNNEPKTVNKDSKNIGEL